MSFQPSASSSGADSANTPSSLLSLRATSTGESNEVPGTGLPPQDISYAPLERASKVVDERLARDERWLGVGDSLTSAASSDYIMPPNPAWAPFQKTRTVLLPDRLFEEYDFTQSRCSMGLLPEIERAWVSVDHRLFLWDWANGAEISTFEELTDVIVGVAIVKPRAGVFVDSISHLLVLTTPTTITLVGLGYTNDTSKSARQLTFFLTGLSSPTDGISLTTIRGTSNGRIFLSSSPSPLVPGGIGGDGCLYELVYQSSEGWFSKKAKLVNLTSGSIAKAVVPSFLRSFSAVPTKEWLVSIEVDAQRGLLYGLLRNGTIEMYQLRSGWDGVPERVARCSDVLRNAQLICPGSPMLDARSFEVIALEVVSVKESGNGKAGLVAITTTGVRLYFTHQRRGYSYYAASNQPSALELCHVRPPPAPAPAQPSPSANPFYGQSSVLHQQQQQHQPQQQQQPSSSPSPSSIAFNNVTRSLYSSGGLLIAANSVNDDVDVLLVASPDIGRVARLVAEGVGSGSTLTNGSQPRPFSEIASTIAIEGRTWGMCEITSASWSSSMGSASGLTALNELATQVTMPRREWVVLTNMGASVVVRQRPVDTLLGVLEAASKTGNGSQGEVGVFFESYGRDQSCAMLLMIAAGNSRLTLGDGTSSFARSSSGFNGFASVSRNASTSIADQAKSLFFEGGGRPVSIDRGGYGVGQKAMPLSDSKIIFSGRHEGLAFYFARLIRSIWKQRITLISPTPGSQSRQISNVSNAVLSSVQRDLSALRSFVQQESQLFASLPEGRSSQNDSAYHAEQLSLSSLHLLLTQSVEGISFILLLIDYQLSDIVASCAVDLQHSLSTLTYQDLLTTKKGRDVARSLVSAIINQQIGQSLSVDSISEILQQRCGSFCSADDVILYKAIEALRRGKDTSDSSERVECLRESLRLFSKATGHLSLEKLKDVCRQYDGMHYPLGVIDLALSCSQKWDPTDMAVSYYLDGSPANDARAPTALLRKECYDLVFATLERTDEILNEATRSTSNACDTQSSFSLSYDEADGIRTNAYSKALAVQDEHFHILLYDWYISRGMTDQLLETRSPFLEHYLSRSPISLEKYDLLWQYYVRIGRFTDAASILADLAETSLFLLPLHKRVEYLSLAVGNAKSQLPTSSRQSNISSVNGGVEFLKDIEEKLEVALVQIEIYRAVEDLDLSHEEKTSWLSKLEGGLLTISDLYRDVADPLEMLEMILLICHVSDHRDPFLINATWSAILSRAHEEPIERRMDVVTSKIIDLGRRFAHSDVAFPLDTLASMFEKYSFENRSETTAGWLPLTFHSAGIPWESIFVVFDELFTAKVPPWQTKAAFTFLLVDLTELLAAWLSDSSPHRTSQTSSPFPATEIDVAIGKYLMTLSTVGGGVEDTVARLQEIQREIRRRF